MTETCRYLFLSGGLLFLVFGLIHALMTPQAPADAKGLSPREPTFRLAMARQTLLLTRRTNLWLAWVGFNLSHSLGLVLFGVTVLLVGRSQASFIAEEATFGPLAVIISILYLVLSVRYWFRTPILASAFAAICFAASWILMTRR